MLFGYWFYSLTLVQHFSRILGLLRHVDHPDFLRMDMHDYLDQHELLHYFGTNDRSKIPEYQIMTLDEKFSLMSQIAHGKKGKSLGMTKYHKTIQLPDEQESSASSSIKILNEIINSTEPIRVAQIISPLLKLTVPPTISTHPPSAIPSSNVTKTNTTPVYPCPNVLNFSLNLPSIGKRSADNTFAFDLTRNHRFLSADFLSYEIRGPHILPLGHGAKDLYGTEISNKSVSVSCFYTGVGRLIENLSVTNIRDSSDPNASTNGFQQHIRYSVSAEASSGSTRFKRDKATNIKSDGKLSRSAIVALDFLDNVNGFIRVGDDEYYVIKPLQNHIIRRVRRRRRMRREANLHDKNAFSWDGLLNKAHLIYKYPNLDFIGSVVKDLGMGHKLPTMGKVLNRASKRKGRSRKRRRILDIEDGEWNKITDWDDLSANQEDFRETRSTQTVTSSNIPAAPLKVLDKESSDDGSIIPEIWREKPVFTWDISHLKVRPEEAKAGVMPALKNFKKHHIIPNRPTTSKYTLEEDIVNTIYNNIRENEGDEYFQQAFYPKTCSVNKYYNDTIDEKDIAYIKNVQLSSEVDVSDLDFDIFDTVGHSPIVYRDEANGTAIIKNLTDQTGGGGRKKVVYTWSKKKRPKSGTADSTTVTSGHIGTEDGTERSNETEIGDNSMFAGKSVKNLKSRDDIRNVEDSDGVIHASSRTTKNPVLELAGFLDQALITLKIERNRMNIAEIRNQYLSLFHFVHLLYMHPTIGTPININLVRLFLMTQNPAQIPAANSFIRSLIMQFSHYQYALNSQRIWDNSVLLTGNDLYDLNGAITEKRVIGYGFFGQFVCDPILSVSLNEGMDGFGSAITITHEMGHNFGMDHDTVGSGCDSHKYIMAENLGIGQVTWSSCSAKLITNNIKTQAFGCLYRSNIIPHQVPEHGSENRISEVETEDTNIFTRRIFPGILYNINEQCKSFNGPNSGHDMRQNLETICQYVLCTNTISRFYRFPALEGTICAHQKWCRGGMCVYQNNSTNRLINREENGWSPWYLSVPCTSLCLEGGTGIEEFRRSCLSSKDDQDKDCKGDFIYYNTCNATCPKKLTTMNNFIAARCENGTVYQQNFHFNGKGHQKSFRANNRGESCRLYCNYKLSKDRSVNELAPKSIIRSILPTGTRCNTRPLMYCIKGVCQSVNPLDPYRNRA